MRSVPDWFPGTGFKRVAADWRGVLDRTVDQPHAFVKQQMVIYLNILRNELLTFFCSLGIWPLFPLVYLRVP